MAVLRAPHLEPGFRLYQNAWTGFATMYPEGWSAHASQGSGVRFRSPDEQAELELNLLPAQAMVTAPQYVDLYMRSLPHHQSRLLQSSAEDYAQAQFQGPEWEGMLSVHLTPQGGTLGVARQRSRSGLDLEPAFAQMLSSLSPILPIPRERWIDPGEQSFEMESPTGWQRQAALRPPAGGQGMRQPMCRLSADPKGHIFLAIEPEFRDFLDQPLPPPPAAEEGFFQKLGRYAREMDQAMTASMGGVICPFRGMRPAFEVFFWPHWQRQIPGTKLLGYEDHGAHDSADVRLLLPGDVVRVYHLVGLPIPNMGMGPPRWLGGHSYFYQAPLALIEKFDPIFQGMAASFKQSPAWRQREMGMAQMQFQQASQMQNQMDQQWMAHSQNMHQQRMNDISLQAQGHAQITANQQAMSDMQMQGWQSWQQTSDSIGHQSVNAINERSDFANHSTGEVHNLSVHYSNYWDTGRDLIVGSNVTLQPPPDWTPLQSWDGRS